jgi:pimeloyl-ACP methyl ester carboxylesterase
MPTINLDDYQHKARYMSLAGHNMAYWHEKNASPENVLFIHGFPSASCDWYHQWRAFEGEMNLLAMDLLGFGLSAKPFPYRYTLAEQAELIALLLKRLGWQRCHIVAHDYGDSVAQQLLFLQEEKTLSFHIQTISFLNGGLFSEAHRPLLMQKLLKSPLGPVLIPFLNKRALERGLHKIFGTKTPPKQQELDILWQLLNAQRGTRCLPALLRYIDERAIHREHWLQAMRHSEIAMQFINGRFDPISGVHMANRVQELVPKVKTVLLEAGHYPQSEMPQEVNQILRTFWL